MRIILRHFAFTLAAVLLFSAAAWAQTGMIDGVVKDENGQPVKDAVIKIDRQDIRTHWQTKTDKKGHFMYMGFDPTAVLKVTLEINGQVRGVRDNIKPGLGDPTPVNFDLKQAAESQQGIQQTLANGGQLTKEQAAAMSKEQRDAYDKALKQQDEAMTKRKELNDAFNQGLDALKAKQFDVAEQAFLKASEADPKQPSVWANLGESYAGVADGQTGADQEATYGKAIDAYNQALTLTPDNATFHTNLATILAKDKKFPEAEAEVAKAVQIAPATAAKGYYNLGATLVNAGQPEAAIDSFKQAIGADPNYAPAYYQYAVALSAKLTTEKEGDVVKIIAPPGMKEALEKYLALDPHGEYAENATALLQSISSDVSAGFSKPGSKSTTKKK